MTLNPVVYLRLLSFGETRTPVPLSALFICFLFLALLPAFSSASSPFISDIEVHSEGREFFFSADLKGGITSEIKQLIVSGAPVPFRYFITLKRKRRGWVDKTVGRITVIKALKYDLLKKVYKTSEITRRKGKVFAGEVKRGAHSDLDRTIVDFTGAIIWISELRHVFLLNSDRIKPSGEYYIQVRADLRTTNIWVPFNYILFFLSFWDVETGWTFSPTFSRDALLAQ